MAYVHEIKFFMKDDELHAALFDNPPLFSNEFWIKNVKAKKLGITKLPENVELEKKYPVGKIGLKSFYATKPEFIFMDTAAKIAWETGKKVVSL